MKILCNFYFLSKGKYGMYILLGSGLICTLYMFSVPGSSIGHGPRLHVSWIHLQLPVSKGAQFVGVPSCKPWPHVFVQGPYI